MTNTTIRRATGADFPTLLDIDATSFPDGLAYDAEELFYFMNQPGAETWLLESEGRIAAFMIVDVDRRSRWITLVTLDVLQDYRRLGFGSILMRKSEEIALENNARNFRLQVDVTNAGAIRFYEKHQFQASRKLPHYYSNGNDAFLMIKRLGQGEGA
jgi:ribosomal-protein-alanine N-acetyltransferase